MKLITLFRRTSIIAASLSLCLLASPTFANDSASSSTDSTQTDSSNSNDNDDSTSGSEADETVININDHVILTCNPFPECRLDWI